MKTSFVVAAFSLFASTLAAPSTLDSRQNAAETLVVFTVTNDISGANAQRVARADGTVNKIGDLFAGSALAKEHGKIVATSAQLNTIIPGALCIFKNAQGTPVGLLNERITFTGLDGVEEKSIETDVSGFTFQCEI